MSLKDVPAAHSMDSTWFALDADGCVGVFQTGESGAIPKSAPCAGEAGSFDSFFIYALRFARLVARGPIARPPRALPERAERVVVVFRDVAKDDAEDRYRKAARASTGAEARLDAVSPVVLQATTPRIVATSKPVSVALQTELSQLSDVERVLTESGLYWQFEERDESCDTLLEFHNDDGEPGAYTRRRMAQTPIAIDDLPPVIREAVAFYRFPVRFAEAGELHLADFMQREDTLVYDPSWGLRGEDLGDQAAVRVPPSRRPPVWLAVCVLAVLLTLLIAFLNRR